uniref:Uncharacterized protein n=1 Tax=uncultured marine virus TaxID=186617 RepID=A0A0F7L595_9VIRU|nr:hypothetical protein [uncultured marine virus]
MRRARDRPQNRAEHVARRPVLHRVEPVLVASVYPARVADITQIEIVVPLEMLKRPVAAFDEVIYIGHGTTIRLIARRVVDGSRLCRSGPRSSGGAARNVNAVPSALIWCVTFEMVPSGSTSPLSPVAIDPSARSSRRA